MRYNGHMKRLLMLTIVGIWLLNRHPIKTQSFFEHIVEPGDSWAALAWRYNLDEKAINQHINTQRQPTIGTTIRLPLTSAERMGTLVRIEAGGLLQTAVRANMSPWSLAIQNDIPHPYHPTFHQPIFLPRGTQPPRDLPANVLTLELSQVPAIPGQAIAYRTQTTHPTHLTAWLNTLEFDSFSNGRHAIGLLGTGAFFGPGEPELAIQTENGPLWTQPWQFVDDEWAYQQITLTGEAAAISQEAIAEERVRLFALWSQATASPQWSTPFQLPIENYLSISSAFGARRSYNGGPYRTYHEGVDFSAYGGTPVIAPATGTVILAEILYVRGGAVILDHGLGVYSGYYHMSSIHVAEGNIVAPGQLLGEVGTTGLSTGNHLHWDFLVADTWVDASAWVEQGMGCWILAGLGTPCP